MNPVQQWLRFFEQVSCFCKQGILLLWEKYPNHTTDIWDSLAIFLEGYAFERQGRKPDYSHAAVDALLSYKKEHNGNINKSIDEDIWRHFSRLLNNQHLNHQNNPLCPKETEYPRKDKKEPCTTRKQSIIELVFSDMVPEGLTFTNYFKNKITGDQDLQNAHKQLKSIQGISDPMLETL